MGQSWDQPESWLQEKEKVRGPPSATPNCSATLSTVVVGGKKEALHGRQRLTNRLCLMIYLNNPSKPVRYGIYPHLYDNGGNWRVRRGSKYFWWSTTASTIEKRLALD